MKGSHSGIVSPDKEIFNGEVDSVTSPSTFGSFTILPKHASVVLSLKAGMLSCVTRDGGGHVQDIHGGSVEMNDNKASAYVD